MRDVLVADNSASSAIPVFGVTAATLEDRLSALPPAAANWANAQDFKGKGGSALSVPDAEGNICAVLIGLDTDGAHAEFAAGALASLGGGDYRLADGFEDRDKAALAFALSSYRFDAYRTNSARPRPRLLYGTAEEADALGIVLDGVKLARDLVNTPANDLGPAELAETTRALFVENGGEAAITVGDDLLAAGFPLVHAVGAGSARAPRLIDCRWGDAAHPAITLVGKGVVFDTGGLDIKPSSSMLLMKKDMGGAANVLGLASMIIAAQLPVRLRVIIPAVENAIGGDAFRPGDIFRSRNGLTVEIGNTDAEGRLVLADALALADEERPDLLVDMATLTGAARVALGPDLPPFYTHDEALAADIARHAEAANDPLWRLPLWKPYARYLDSRTADINNVNQTGAGFAGSITAALFLSRFVENTPSWAHFDIFAWTPAERPGRPTGGEAQAIRALYAYLCEKYRR
ncbi:leucyl aminopeptidase family protein [Stappia sp. F7233]|uniref:Leucyl aminopeptidase family protein n=1 Tax=Stappia albiluteola TaxID=2758565 RepID=A0A839AAR8_9HYPH|nr:leucyl aminopeptidase family protein [Stappia albiluteola]MBA5776225.1 leucyl aminopeptidase family protein [Stappia albiluteola]